MGDQGPYACATAVARATPVDIKNLMTGFNGNSKFCFTETLKVPRSEAEGALRSRGNKTHYTSQLNTKKKARRKRLIYAGWLITLLRFQGATVIKERLSLTLSGFTANGKDDL